VTSVSEVSSRLRRPRCTEQTVDIDDNDLVDLETLQLDDTVPTNHDADNTTPTMTSQSLADLPPKVTTVTPRAWFVNDTEEQQKSGEGQTETENDSEQQTSTLNHVNHVSDQFSATEPNFPHHISQLDNIRHRILDKYRASSPSVTSQITWSRATPLHRLAPLDSHMKRVKRRLRNTKLESSETPFLIKDGGVLSKPGSSRRVKLRPLIGRRGKAIFSESPQCVQLERLAVERGATFVTQQLELTSGIPIAQAAENMAAGVTSSGHVMSLHEHSMRLRPAFSSVSTTRQLHRDNTSTVINNTSKPTAGCWSTPGSTTNSCSSVANHVTRSLTSSTSQTTSSFISSDVTLPTYSSCCSDVTNDVKGFHDNSNDFSVFAAQPKIVTDSTEHDVTTSRDMTSSWQLTGLDSLADLWTQFQNCPNF